MNIDIQLFLEILRQNSEFEFEIVTKEKTFTLERKDSNLIYNSNQTTFEQFSDIMNEYMHFNTLKRIILKRYIA